MNTQPDTVYQASVYVEGIPEPHYFQSRDMKLFECHDNFWKPELFLRIEDGAKKSTIYFNPKGKPIQSVVVEIVDFTSGASSYRPVRAKHVLEHVPQKGILRRHLSDSIQLSIPCSIEQVNAAVREAKNADLIVFKDGKVFHTDDIAAR